MENRIKSYSELMNFFTFEDRLNYLKLDSRLFGETFGFDRYLNQKFYSSFLWKRIRSQVLVRDLGCDLGIKGFEINLNPVIHHMNPLSPDDFVKFREENFSPEFLITTSVRTHRAIHFGIDTKIQKERFPKDTTLW